MASDEPPRHPRSKIRLDFGHADDGEESCGAGAAAGADAGMRRLPLAARIPSGLFAKLVLEVIADCIATPSDLGRMQCVCKRWKRLIRAAVPPRAPHSAWAIRAGNLSARMPEGPVTLADGIDTYRRTFPAATLVRLNVTHGLPDDTSFPDVAASLAGTSALSSLELNCNHFRDAMPEVLQAIAEVPAGRHREALDRISRLRLHWAAISTVNFRAIASMRSLRELRLEVCLSEAGGFATLAGLRLERLFIMPASRCGCDHHGDRFSEPCPAECSDGPGEADIATITGMTTLTALDLRRCARLPRALLNTLGHSMPQLRELSLCNSSPESRVPLDAAEMEGLARLTKLTKLQLSRSPAWLTGDLLRHVRGLTRLSHVQLGADPPSRVLTDHSLTMMGGLRSLGTLLLEGHLGLTDAGLVAALAPAWREPEPSSVVASRSSQPLLRRLVLRGCKGITGAGVGSLRAALGRTAGEALAVVRR